MAFACSDVSLLLQFACHTQRRFKAKTDKKSRYKEAEVESSEGRKWLCNIRVWFNKVYECMYDFIFDWVNPWKYCKLVKNASVKFKHNLSNSYFYNNQFICCSVCVSWLLF